MNNQEIFDTMVSSVIKQGCPSVEFVPFGQQCRYRNNEGFKCAFGFLIPDDVYDPNMESKVASNLIVSNSKLKIYEKHISIIEAVQKNHDEMAMSNEFYVPVNDADFLRDFKIQCRITAQEFNLVWNHGDI